MGSLDWRARFERVLVTRNGVVITVERLDFGAGSVAIWPFVGSLTANRATHYSAYDEALRAWELYNDLDKVGPPTVTDFDHCPECGARITDADPMGCETASGQRWCLRHLPREADPAIFDAWHRIGGHQ